VTEGTTTELEAGIVAEDFNQRRHVPYVDTTRSNGHGARKGSVVLGEENTARTIFFNVVFTHEVYETKGSRAITFELTNNGTGVEVVTTGEAETLSQNTEVNTVVLLTVNYRVHCTVNVEKDTIVTAPLSQGSVRSETTG
jgi:hypothetical protein